MANWGTIRGANVMARLAGLGTDRRLPLVATLLLIALLAQALAQLTWKILPAQQQAVVLPTAPTHTVERAGENQSVTINRIGQWHLFGEIQKAAPKAVAQVTEAPDTHLNLKLRGLLATSNAVTARAIIADGKGAEESYAIGQQLPGGAVLREIYADRVILEYRGRLEALRLPKEASANVSVTQNTTSRSSGRGVNQASTAENTALLRQYRDALTNNPQSLMDLVNATPVTEKDSGMLKGYRIRPGKDRSLLGRFGLKSGDVVTGVNGVALNNPIKALEIMRDLSTATSVTLDVERNGVMQSFAFQVE